MREHGLVTSAAGSPHLRIYAAGDALLLEGEIDYFSSDALARVLVDSGVPLAGMPVSMRRTCDLMGLA